VNLHPYDERDIDVATQVIARIYDGVDANHGVAAVAVLDAVMVARHRRDAERRQQFPRRMLRTVGLGALNVAGVLSLVAIGVLGTLAYLGLLPAR
jgi:hypothetical protein